MKVWAEIINLISFLKQINKLCSRFTTGAGGARNGCVFNFIHNEASIIIVA